MKKLTPFLAVCLGFAHAAYATSDDVTRSTNSPAELSASIVPNSSSRGTATPQTRVAALSNKSFIPQRKVIVISRDDGGDLVNYAKRVSRARQEKDWLVFNGQCASACTLYLSLDPKQMCITKNTSFVFHAAYGAKRDVNQWGTRYLAKQYPDWVQNWIAKRGGLSNRILRMSYTQASKHINPCKIAKSRPS
ncbi:hypothetical protein AB9F29_12270 [Falsihalocynthiibacter sp. S25ZX9]|uniref:hypothetical protein n=1 Tax=Falsihalocynthiibacter sp. S25ZX9 TaxID=3240870 RepID=UPI00350F2AC3